MHKYGGNTRKYNGQTHKCYAPQVEIVSKVGHKMLVSHYYGDMSHSWPVTVNDSSKKEQVMIASMFSLRLAWMNNN